jgi:hypothetical protein
MFLKALPVVINTFDKVSVRLDDFYRRQRAHEESTHVAGLRHFQTGDSVPVSVIKRNAPWLKLTPRPVTAPSMITHEEAQYYTYIGSFYSGAGRAIELGPWLSASTHHIVRALESNPNFRSRLFVVDDFIWRPAWMNPHVPPEQRLPAHACFRHMFDCHARSIAHLLDVHRAKIVDYDGNESLPSLHWSGEPIELLYVDCGRTVAVNDAWYTTLSPFFIKEKTLIIMQDWRTHREIPRQWFNQTKLFTESKGASLRLIHEVSYGGLAAFLFIGA